MEKLLGRNYRKEFCVGYLDDQAEVQERALGSLLLPDSQFVGRLWSKIRLVGENMKSFINATMIQQKAAEKFEVLVKSLSGLKDIGKDLMAKAFKLDSPKIRINDLSTDNEKGAQEGYQFMTMGMMRAIRNVFSQGDENIRTPEECYEMLMFINWLFRNLNQ